MRSRPLAFGGLLLGGLLAEVATAQAWWRASGGGTTVSFTGTDATGGLSQALAVVALAGTLLVLVLRARGRQVVGVLLALTGAGLAVVGAMRLRPPADAVLTKLRQVSLVDSYSLTSTGWPWIYAVAGLLVLAGALVLLLRAGHWPARADRFDRGTTAPAVADDPAGVWRALDAGLDPTEPDSTVLDRAGLDPTGLDHTGPRVAHAPDVHQSGAGDTMGQNADPGPANHP